MEALLSMLESRVDVMCECKHLCVFRGQLMGVYEH